MDLSAQNYDEARVMEDYDEARVMEDIEWVFVDEIRNMRMKFVFDVEPLEIIDKEDDEDFINYGVQNIYDQIDLVIHVLQHNSMYQYWCLKSSDDSLNSSSSTSSSSSCHHQHVHHLGEDDDEEMMMISCEPTCTPYVVCKILVDQGIFASCDQNVVEEDYIMSLLDDVDLLYESERLPTYKHLEELKRCITQRISEAKPAVLMAKPKIVRIRVHLSTIEKRYYADSAAANSAAAQDVIELRRATEAFALHFPSYQQRPPSPEYDMKPTLRSIREALETRIFRKEDLTSSLSCPVCLIEFRVDVDRITIMPCSHVFHPTCLSDWLYQRNTCPLCRHELPTCWKPPPPNN